MATAAAAAAPSATTAAARLFHAVRRTVVPTSFPTASAGWDAPSCCSRLGKSIGLEHEPSNKLVGVELDGDPAPFPPGDPPLPADLLSDELDKLSRDPIYEAAVLAAVT